MNTPFIIGFSTSLALILAIGAQNAFVLRQGLRREHVGAVVAFCAIADAALILLGVFGAGAFIAATPWLGFVMTWAGITFLMVYGIMRLMAAWRGDTQLDTSGEATTSLQRVLITLAAFTFLNPHVYLDTIVLMGSLSLPYVGSAKQLFATGAAMGSLIFFTALGYGARLLSPIFQSPRAWQILDFFIGILMFVLAYVLWSHS